MSIKSFGSAKIACWYSIVQQTVKFYACLTLFNILPDATFDDVQHSGEYSKESQNS